MRLMSITISCAAMLAVTAGNSASGQQPNQSDTQFLQQRAGKSGEKARKSGSIVIYDQDRKKPGALKAKGGGKTVQEGGQNTFTHKPPSGGKNQKKPDTLGRVKTQLPWQRRD